VICCSAVPSRAERDTLSLIATAVLERTLKRGVLTLREMPRLRERTLRVVRTERRPKDWLPSLKEHTPHLERRNHWAQRAALQHFFHRKCPTKGPVSRASTERGYMKRAIPVLFAILCLSACAETQKDWAATGGNLAEGTIELSYEYGEFEEPHVDEAQAEVVANSTCHEWGYSSFRAFGRPIKKCNRLGGFFGGCASWIVTRQYRCISAASRR
jgi:hypothetical protein